MGNPTCIELFAGAGGASLGLHRLGFRSLLAAEWDPDACETHRVADMGPVYEGDVRKLRGELTFKEPPLLMWASPPCQAFSSAGKRLGALDERNGWPWTLDILDRMEASGCRPTWVICENVPGLTHHKGDCPREADLEGESVLDMFGFEEPEPEAETYTCPGCYWEKWIIPEFEKRFGAVTVGIIDASDYGVPQRRRRVFLVAGPEPYEWPKPTHSFHNLVHDKWVSGAYWTRHGMAPPEKGPSVAERKVLESLEMREGGREPGVEAWVTVRDALGLGFPIRHQSPSAMAVQHLPDETAPTVSIKGTLYAESEVQDVGRHNPHYHDVRVERDAGVGAAREPRSIDEPSYTVRVQHHGGGGGINLVGDTPAELWIRQDSTGSAARPVDEPSHPVATSGMLYLHDDDPGSRPQKHPDASKRRSEGPRVIGGGGNPHGPNAESERNYRDLTDEPSTTIAAQQAGNAGPWLVDDSSKLEALRGLDVRLLERNSGSRGLEEADVDAVAPTVLGGDGIRGWDRLQVEAGGGDLPDEAEDDLDFLEAEDDPDKVKRKIGNYTAHHDFANPGDQPELVDGPFRTVSATEVKGASSFGKLNRASDDLFLATGRRRLTVLECALLQGFPEDYPFQGTATSQYKQVGNAVCPQVSEALGRFLLERPNR